MYQSDNAVVFCYTLLKLLCFFDSSVHLASEESVTNRLTFEGQKQAN